MESLGFGLRDRGMSGETADGGNPAPGSIRGVRGALIVVWVMPKIVLGSGNRNGSHV